MLAGADTHTGPAVRDSSRDASRVGERPAFGGSISKYEPKVSSVPGLTSAGAVWLVRYLARTENRPVVKTLLVLDGPDGSFFGNVYAVTPEAVVRQ